VSDARKSVAFFVLLKTLQPGVAVLFALAGLLSAYVGSSYSAWVAKLFAENSQSVRLKACYQDCEAHKTRAECMGTCEEIAEEGWYQGNLALTTYADRQWWIWGLSFPVALTVAILLGLGLHWLPAIEASHLVAGLVMLFLSSAVAAIVMIAATGLLWTLAPLAAAVAYAWLLARIRNFLGEGRTLASSIFRPLLISIVAGAILGEILHLVFPMFAWFSGVEVFWALVFGASLTSVPKGSTGAMV
jgi:hypothetical protein